MQLLGSELALSGMGTRLLVIALTRATRGEGASAWRWRWPPTFAGVGTSTILVSADLRARTVCEQEGLSALLDGTATPMPLTGLEDLMRLRGLQQRSAGDAVLGARVEHIVRDLRHVAGVVVIDTPAVLERSETLPLIACSDIVLLTVRPSATRWALPYRANLPNIAYVREQGASGTLISTVPPITAAAWPSMMTGWNPGRHGMSDFRTLGIERYSRLWARPLVVVRGRPRLRHLAALVGCPFWDQADAPVRSCRCR